MKTTCMDTSWYFSLLAISAPISTQKSVNASSSSGKSSRPSGRTNRDGFSVTWEAMGNASVRAMTSR